MSFHYQRPETRKTYGTDYYTALKHSLNKLTIFQVHSVKIYTCMYVCLNLS